MEQVNLNEVTPGYDKFEISEKAVGKKLFTVDTFSPASANPGAKLYIKLPDLGAGECLVPNSFYLTGVFNRTTQSHGFETTLENF